MNPKIISLPIFFCFLICSCKQNSNNDYKKKGAEIKNEQIEKIESKETIYFDKKNKNGEIITKGAILVRLKMDLIPMAGC